MPNERSVLCGNVSRAKLPFGEDRPLCLYQWGQRKNIRLQIADIYGHLLSDIPSPLHDLIEVASYVYCADQAVTRGGNTSGKFGENWRRRLFFRIPVRNPDLWNSAPVKDSLVETLSFLSEDEYFFEFEKLNGAPPTQQALGFETEHMDEVALFSGGLDSLGGAIQEAVLNKKKVALVMHRPTSKLQRRHKKLIELLKVQCHIPPLHVPVIANKEKRLGKEYTQRSRSFLYVALGSTVARIFHLNRLRVYENGIISFNLPLAPQVVGARATRTTHPRVLEGFSKIVTLLSEKPFSVENPFIWKTKTDVLKIIAEAGCKEMIPFATSCTHTWEMTNEKTHCGACSQCIDRRFAVLANGLEDNDPAEAYGTDLVTGERQGGESRTMLSAYLATADELSSMRPDDFFGRFGEAARVLKHLGDSSEAAAIKLFNLHQQHARAVVKVIDESIEKNATDVRKGTLPDSCLVRLVCDGSGPPEKMPDSPSSTEREKEPGDFVFRKNGQAWSVRFNGGEGFILLPSKGAAYLHLLLSSPGKDFDVTDLVLEVACSSKKYVLDNAGDVIDQVAEEQYREKYETLKEELVEAEALEEKGQAGFRSASQIREDIFFLSEQIKKDKGFGKRKRKLSDDRDKMRKSFRAAIRSVIDTIKKYDKRFAAHLKSPTIRCGWRPCYDPREDITWEV